MPGKYPTIEVLSTTRKAIEVGAQPDGVGLSLPNTSLSNSETASLKLMFSKSPIYKITAAEYRTTAQGLLLGGATGTKQLGDPNQFPDGVDLNYTDSPNLTNGIDGFDSPYYPNLIVGADPAGSEGTPGATPVPINDNFGSGLPVTEVIPSATSAALSTTSIDVLGPVGIGGRSAAHDLNPGATNDSIITAP
jgi:hypothetical protein